jgi:hypothetical protein
MPDASTSIVLKDRRRHPMPRTPKPETTKLQTVRVEMHNQAFIARESARLGRSIGLVFNEELAFARTAGLPPVLLRLLTQHLKRERSSLREEFKTVAWNAAMELPAVPWPPEKEEPPLDRTYHVASVNLDGANREHLKELAASTGRGFTAVMNDELQFAQTLGLRPELQARLAAHLKQTGATVREWGMMEMWERALPLRRSTPTDDYPTARPLKAGPPQKHK